MKGLPLSDEVVRSRDEVGRDLVEDIEDHGYTAEEAAMHYKGALGYMIIFETGAYVRGVEGALRELRARFVEVECRNLWESPDTGPCFINSVWRDSNTEQVFKVQIHTRETAVLAKGESHDWYEILRNGQQPLKNRFYAQERIRKLWSPIRMAAPEQYALRTSVIGVSYFVVSDTEGNDRVLWKLITDRSSPSRSFYAHAGVRQWQEEPRIWARLVGLADIAGNHRRVPVGDALQLLQQFGVEPDAWDRQ